MRLYKQGKNKTLVWEINIHGNVLVIMHGTLNGNMQENRTEVEVGKQGRSTEEQAQNVMQRSIEMKLRAGYGKEIENLPDCSRNQLGFLKPMLAHSSAYKKISYNAYVQRKYNGHRCLVTLQDGVMQAYSRGGKQILSINHIIDSLRKSGAMKEGETIDGELYRHGLSLQKISSLVNTKTKTSHEIKYVLYDTISDKKYSKRLERVKEFKDIKYVSIAKTKKVSYFTEVEKLFFKYKKQGYEGAIVRFGTSGYLSGQRNIGVMKVKKIGGIGYIDEEFKVIGIIGSKEDWAILICVTSEGERFRVSAPGTHKQKRYVLDNIESFVGRYIKVEFPEWAESGKPSQPVAIMFRDKENE